jgi:sec-independent protein translocase protein TatA
MGGFTSGSHWLIVFGIVILLFGAKKIPELAKGFGQGIRNFKKEMKEEDTPATPEAPKQVDTVVTTSVEAPKIHTQA